MRSLFVLLHLPQSAEIIGLNGVSTSLIGCRRLTPLSETVQTDIEGDSVTASQKWQVEFL